MKVELHIGRLVVHGAVEFDREAFVLKLQDDVRCRLPKGVEALRTARSFDVEGGSIDAKPKPIAGSTAFLAASAVARRLVR